MLNTLEAGLATDIITVVENTLTLSTETSVVCYSLRHLYFYFTAFQRKI